LGIEVTHSPDGLALSQVKYSQDLLHRAGMLQCNPTTTPMSVNEKLSTIEGTLPSSDDATSYRSIVGGLQYLAPTRPNISSVVNHVC
jgi:histone deacetylase 1/2